MEALKQVWVVLKGIAAVAVLVGLAGLFLIGLWVMFARFSSDLAATAITLLVGAVIAAYQFNSSNRSERERAIQQEHRAAKSKEYESFIKTLLDSINQGKPGVKKLAEAELMKSMHTFVQKAMIWGSDEVVQAFGDFMNATSVADTKDFDEQQRGLFLMLKMESLVAALRKDLGHSNAALAQGDIMRLFITDFDTVLRPKLREPVSPQQQSSK